MHAKEVSKLVELADRVVVDSKEKPLNVLEKSILQQALEGKNLKDIQYGRYGIGHIQNQASKLWKKLSKVTGQKATIKTVQQVLEELQNQKSQFENTPQLVSPAKLQAELKGEANHSSSASSLELRKGKTTSKKPESGESEKSIYANCTNHQDSSQAQLLHHPPNPRTQEENKNRKLASSELVGGMREVSKNLDTRCEQFNNPEQGDRIIFDWDDFIKFLKPGIPLLLSVGLLGSCFALSWLFNGYGVTNHLAGNLPKAQFFYFFSHKFNPISPINHQNQGAIYEDQGNYQKAHTEYQLALEGGLIEAYNNQARLYILEGNYEKAVDLLRIGLPLAKDNDIKYTLLKNRAWARLGQGFYDDAKIDLEAAIQLKKRESTAYCLLAQVLESKQDMKGAIVQWEKCRAYAYQPQLPEEDKWMHLAQQRLDAKGSQK
jgi:tetratricopeptide (TPR) repeat protein